MQISNIPFVTTDWSQIEPTEHKGERGTSHWRTGNAALLAATGEAQADDAAGIIIRASWMTLRDDIPKIH